MHELGESPAFYLLLPFNCKLVIIKKNPSHLNLSYSPGKAPPGTGQRAEDGSEGQSREERVEGEVEQSLHPIIAQAFQRVNVVLKENGWGKKNRKIKKQVGIN